MKTTMNTAARWLKRCAGGLWPATVGSWKKTSVERCSASEISFIPDALSIITGNQKKNIVEKDIISMGRSAEDQRETKMMNDEIDKAH
jgi:hypothetical protein